MSQSTHSDYRFWRAVLPTLTKHCRVVFSFDIKGHGGARGAPLAKSLENLADDAPAFA
jgi:3-oxoadipate enol-lactonase